METATLKEDLTFEKFSALKRRQQSAKQAEAVLSAAAAAGLDASTVPPGAVFGPAGEDVQDPFLTAFTVQCYMLLIVTVDVLCVVYHLVYSLNREAVEAAAASGTGPGSKLLPLTLHGLDIAFHYLAYLTWMVSFGELVVYMNSVWSKRSLSALRWARAADGLLVLLHGALLVSNATPLTRLLQLGRAVRVVDVLTMASAEVRTRTQTLQAAYLEERQRTESARTQLEQLNAKWAREAEIRGRAEQALNDVRQENVALQEALYIAARNMAELQAVAGVYDGVLGGEGGEEGATGAGTGTGMGPFVGAEDMSEEEAQALAEAFAAASQRASAIGRKAAAASASASASTEAASSHEHNHNHSHSHAGHSHAHSHTNASSSSTVPSKKASTGGASASASTASRSDASRLPSEAGGTAGRSSSSLSVNGQGGRASGSGSRSVAGSSVGTGTGTSNSRVKRVVVHKDGTASLMS